VRTGGREGTSILFLLLGGGKGKAHGVGEDSEGLDGRPGELSSTGAAIRVVKKELY